MTFLLWAARSAPLGAQPRWYPGLGSTSLLTLSYPTGGPGGQGGGGCKKMLMTARRYEAASDCFPLCWHGVLFAETRTSCARQPRRAAVHKASRERRLTSPRSLAPGLAFLCLPLVCCRNLHLFGLRGKERHLGTTLGEQGHTCPELGACDLALALRIPPEHSGCAASARRNAGAIPPHGVWPCQLPRAGRCCGGCSKAPSLEGAGSNPALLAVLTWPECRK